MIIYVFNHLGDVTEMAPMSNPFFPRGENGYTSKLFYSSRVLMCVYHDQVAGVAGEHVIINLALGAGT